VSAGQKCVGVEVRKGPRCPGAGTPIAVVAGTGPGPVDRHGWSSAAVGDAHEVVVPRGLEVQTPKPGFESVRKGVRTAHGVPLAPILGVDHHRDGSWEADLEREAPYLARQLSRFSTVKVLYRWQ
jgi:hypothetical protein